MGSDLYSVRAVASRGRHVTLEVQCIHPDVLYVVDDPGFALMVIFDAASYDTSTPITDEIALDDLLDQEWASTYVRGFIEEVRADEVHNPPPEDLFEDRDHPYWERDDWLSWRLEVTASHEAWVEHIERGDSWASRAFSPASKYAPHDPIAPTPDELMEDPEGMFVWVPRECFLEHAAAWATLPALLEMPAYPATRYAVEERELPLDESWLGRPIWTRSSYGFEEIGTVIDVSRPRAPGVATMSTHSYGIRHSEIEGAGALHPKVSERPGQKLTYATILERAPTTVPEVTCTESTAKLTLRVPPDGRTPPIETETDALDALVAPLWERRDSGFSSKEPALLRALLADGVARGIEGAHRFKEVFPAVARDYIESFELDFDPAPALPLDGLSHDRAREALGAPWPTATLVVVVSEARWLDHLRASLTTFTLRGRTLPAPTDEDIPPPAGPPPEADERAVLWRDDPGPEVWVVERRGTEIHQRWGRRDRRDHEETVEPHASVADAREHLQTIVSDRRQRGYERLADRDEARARVESALGVTFACSAPPIIAEARDPARDVDDTHRLRPLDVITAVGVMGGASFDRLTTLEGLAAALDRRRDESITYVWFERPASRAFASISVELGP